MSTYERTTGHTVIRAVALATMAWMAVIGVASAQGQASREPVRTITKIRGDLYRFQNDRHNTVFLVTSEGVIVGDPINADAATWLKNQIAARFKVPVRYVLYSHSDWDHASGARIFNDTAELWGHANMAAAIKNASNPDQMKDVLPPERTYTDRQTITLGGKRVELVHPGPNHSPDATVLFFPAERVIHVVDYITVRRVPPRFGGAPIAAWIKSMRAVEALDFDVVSPGHGNVGTKLDVSEQREYAEALVDGVSKGIAAGRSAKELQATNMLDKFSWWEGYETVRNANIEEAYKELSAAAQRSPSSK
jgi:glyoxylase-like metal-dependent hydrolase (beta-lactamase superfamily II)